MVSKLDFSMFSFTRIFPRSDSVHEYRMEDTKVEEESSVAAYGLVALCDQQPYEDGDVEGEECTQFSEEIVETTDQQTLQHGSLQTGNFSNGTQFELVLFI